MKWRIFDGQENLLTFAPTSSEAMKRKIPTLMLALTGFCNSVMANELPQDFMRSTGKINVVVAVILVLFLLLVLFLISLERRLSKLEKKVFENG
jgi:uncharacterized membrane protein YdbT with pleckstrin-like domain